MRGSSSSRSSCWPPAEVHRFSQERWREALQMLGHRAAMRTPSPLSGGTPSPSGGRLTGSSPPSPAGTRARTTPRPTTAATGAPTAAASRKLTRARDSGVGGFGLPAGRRSGGSSATWPTVTAAPRRPSGSGGRMAGISRVRRFGFRVWVRLDKWRCPW